LVKKDHVFPNHIKVYMKEYVRRKSLGLLPQLEPALDLQLDS